jgi:hypothetical protein
MESHASEIIFMTTPQTIMSVKAAIAATEYSKSLSAAKNDLGGAAPPDLERIVSLAKAVIDVWQITALSRY